jgi:phosphoribosylformylglycinamidine synthase
VGLVKVVGPGGDGGVTRVPGTNKGLATSTDCNSRYVYLNPKLGAAHALVEAARNVAVTGSRPIGVTNNLNFANPHIPENYYMMSESVDGISEACRALGLPVTGGNVSLYNESPDGPIFPTPTIGMVGLIENVHQAIGATFRSPGHGIYLIGDFHPVLGGTEYLSRVHRIVAGQIPALHLDLEKRLMEFLVQAAEKAMITSAHDLSLGGLAAGLFRCVALAEKPTGFALDPVMLESLISSAGRKDAVFFGETAGSVLVGTDREDELEIMLSGASLPFKFLGRVLPEAQMDFGSFKVSVSEAMQSWTKGLEGIF